MPRSGLRSIAIALSLPLAGPAAAGWSIASAPATGPQRLDAARNTIDVAASVLTDVRVTTRRLTTARGAHAHGQQAGELARGAMARTRARLRRPAPADDAGRLIGPTHRALRVGSTP